MVVPLVAIAGVLDPEVKLVLIGKPLIPAATFVETGRPVLSNRRANMLHGAMQASR